MNRPNKYVSPPDDTQIFLLEELIKNDTSSHTRMRAHAVILSSKGFSVDEISVIYDVHRDTVSSWIDRWEENGIEGLYDRPRSGAPRRLSETETDILRELIEKYPNSPKTISAELNKKTGKTVSIRTLRRMIKKFGLRWKRIRKSVKNKRDDKQFEKAGEEIRELKESQKAGDTDIFYFDVSGFSIGSSVPYAYQPVGETVEIPASERGRLNVLGFFSTDNRSEFFCFECNVDTDVVVACFDEFSKIITKQTVIILDNSPIHHSAEFTEHIPKWEKKGIQLKYLPPYSPELNLIEILWRFVKYHWLPISAFLSFSSLVNAVEYVLKNIGSEYQISFT